jgi:hypothetical protein
VVLIRKPDIGGQWFTVQALSLGNLLGMSGEYWGQALIRQLDRDTPA